MHQDDERIAVFVFHDQSLDHGMFGYTELAGGNHRSALFLILIEVIGEFHLVGTQFAYRRCHRRLFLAHRAESAVRIW